MRRSGPPLMLLGLFAFVVTLSASAQEPSEIEHAPDGVTRNHIDSIFVPALANAPFSAKVPVETPHTLPDGTTVTRKFYSIVARDSAGRVHNEDRWIIPGDSTADSPVNYYVFIDPPAETRTYCYPATHVCRITRFRPATSIGIVQPGPLADGKGFLQRTELGKDTLNSLEVIGTRDTVTFHAGAFGNTRDDEGVLVFTAASHQPVGGADRPSERDTTLKVTELNLGEPDPALFVLPADYKRVDERTAAQAQ